jgi:hypothetical protein
LIVTFFIALAAGRRYTIVPTDASNLYLDHLGDANLNRGQLRIETSIERGESALIQHKVNSVWDSIEFLCKNSGNLSQEIRCDMFLTHLAHQKFLISNHLQELSECHKRPKRDLLGKALEYVFGFNKDLYDNIDDLNRDNQKLREAINSQILDYRPKSTPIIK